LATLYVGRAIKYFPWTQAVHVWRRVTGNRKWKYGVEYSPVECSRPEIRQSQLRWILLATIYGGRAIKYFP